MLDAYWQTKSLHGPPLAAQAFGPRRINEAGRNLIKEFEGLRLKAYFCPAGVLTIGYGRTVGVRQGQTITREEAEKFLSDDLDFHERTVSARTTVPLNDNQFAALVSFSFNVGTHNFVNSTLLRLLNRGWYEQVPAQLMRWTRAGGEHLGGLARRRQAEARLWNAKIISNTEL